MSWAARRKTTRLEDEAYCLLGIFGVNLPLLYGEGRRAFVRLQEEIIKNSTDHSIFAWQEDSLGYKIYQTIMDGSYESVDGWLQQQRARPEGKLPTLEEWFNAVASTDTWKDFDRPRLFAISPSSFRDTCAAIVLRGRRPSNLPYALTNQGLQITIPIFQHPYEGWMAILNCRHDRGILALRLSATGKDEFIVGSAPLKSDTRDERYHGDRIAVVHPHHAAVAKCRTITIAREWPDKVADVISKRIKSEGLVYVNFPRRDATRFPLEEYVEHVYPAASTMTERIVITPFENDGTYVGGLALGELPVLGSFVVLFAYDSIDPSSNGVCEIKHGAADASELKGMCDTFAGAIRLRNKGTLRPSSYIRDPRWGHLPAGYLVRAEVQWQDDSDVTKGEKWKVSTGEIVLKINLGLAFSARWALLAFETGLYGESKSPLLFETSDSDKAVSQSKSFSDGFRRKLTLDPDAPHLFAGIDLSGHAFLGLGRRTIFLGWLFCAYINGRFCGPVTPTQTCCLPCPLQQWVSSDNFEYNASIAYWFNVPAFICQVFLLVTFAVLPKELSGKHYLSIGLCVALMLLEISFIIPLAAKPEVCYNDITPRDMYSSMSCAWSGALMEMGSMGAVVWILLRSLWTHLRVCWDMQHTSVYIWLAHALGWGLPALFVAISLPISGLSFRVGGNCLPNPEGAFVTWFGWLIAFGCLGAIIQVGTTGFCLAIYLKSFFRQDNTSFSTTTGTSTISAGSANANGNGKQSARRIGKRLAWRRVRKVMHMQWRSIVLSGFVILETIYFGLIYTTQVANAKESAKPEHTEDIYEWTMCLIQSRGDKDRCIHLAKALSVPESKVITSFFLVSIIGLLTFGLMLRYSMLVGWWEVICNPRTGRRRQSSADWISARPKRLSLGRILGSDRLGSTTAGGEEEMPKPTGILPSPEKERQMSLPEAGDVAKRHETTALFDDEGEEKERGRVLKANRLKGEGDAV